ncbi:ABC transporter permease [Deinococcus sp.]|uniref:ABC transporter permease n=1 Tax=Deinococcus sp. TaxID=47478 RepID=UPI0025BA77DB|nr:ABC transporter permease [Deinococcus sp.]
MLNYVFQRLLGAAITLLLAAALVFGILLTIPGDPAQTLLGLDASPTALAQLRHQLGLDQPPPLRFVHWVTGALHGDLNQSIRYDAPVSRLLRERLSLSLPLIGLTLVISSLLALWLGSAAARAAQARSGRDTWITAGAVLLSALPSFWVGLMLMLAFAVRLHWLPSGGFPGWQEPGRAALALVLPVATLTLTRVAILARMVRSSLLDSLSQDYVRTARAKGVSERRVLYRHALRNALIPIVTVLGVQFAELLTATVIVEAVFSLPGFGTLILSGIEARDYPMVQGVVLVLSALVVLVNLIVDLSYGLLDPRISYG